MFDEEYRSIWLLSELRALTGSNDAEECEICELQHRIVCEHLTNAQYASLKAGKRTVATERARGTLRVFECGHVYDALRLVRRSTRGPKEKTKGFCPDCWRYIYSSGRRMRPAPDVGKRRRSNGSYRSRVDTTRYKRLRGKFRVWRIRGPMIGQVEV
ncbi:hypothetical protein F4859DRAFT_137541 [Xylaria cf. heliscus]|nr:hypothetical protein F4859DRAFT_137541 [Xylaria cf. heliscus]